MHDAEDIFGRRLSREVVREQVVDESTGEEFVCENIIETVERLGGEVEIVQSTGKKLLACGHIQGGQRMARCDACSKKAGRTVYVCEECAITCPMTGQALCVRCTKIGADGRRYSPKGFKQAERMGLFDIPQAASPVCAPGSLLGKLLEWW